MKLLTLPAIAFLPLLLVSLLTSSAVARELKANPSNCAKALRELKAGDILTLEAGRYRPLALAGLNGTADAWITITGPASGAPAIIEGEPGSNTIEIFNSSYLAIENLRIDSRGISGAFGISAKGGAQNHTHDIRIDGNTLVGQNGEQQTDGISTKIPTWGWIIRDNRIIGAGTGIYLGNSDGTDPFVHGLVENNLIENTIGYNMEIKDQVSIPAIDGMPLGTTSTIIRNNVFIKDDTPSPDGDRPNLLVGGFPETGLGFLNLYEIYGNYFVHNHREALFQGSGRISLHDNIFVDGPADYSAVVLRRQNVALKVAYVYNNTVYTAGRGITFGTAAVSVDMVTGNLVFASEPISGPIGRLSNNTVAPLTSAPSYVNSPSFEPGAMDFYPRPGKCQGAPLSLTLVRSDAAYNLDFNGTPKTQAKGAIVFRGAYAGSGTNPGWKLQSAIKPSKPNSAEAVNHDSANTAADHHPGRNSLDLADSAKAGQRQAPPPAVRTSAVHDAGSLSSVAVHADAAGLLLRQPTAGAE